MWLVNIAVIPGHSTPEQYLREVTLANDGILNQQAVYQTGKLGYEVIQELENWGVISSDFSRHVEKLTLDLTPQPPSLLGKGEKLKPLSLQGRGLERGFADPVKSQVIS
ncbi:hypothetical protein [Anabaena azotica]|uniref:Uncharacterized protein n=1 Tax=Anabaena azotica FACHB-119 TaxID=947527 RepID=A0ABR8D3M4_9NOST|nr:hypothetical protein [Anabaena azotica]MBD2501750.1 hypothetical protein [Anabaena azotica FACHB-119]